MKKTALLVTLLCLGASSDLLARHHRGRGGPPMRRCMGMLLQAHPDALKSNLGLNSGQLGRLQAIRTRFTQSEASLDASIVKERAKGKLLWQRDLPPEKEVLAHLRRMHRLRGQEMELRVKTSLELLKLLKREQRAKLRARCVAGGPKQERRAKGSCRGNCGCPNCARGGW
jgi:Spy/CpxP family protein refolding chaperone